MKTSLRIGVDLGGTKIEGIIVDPSRPWNEWPRERMATDASGGYERIVDTVVLMIEKLQRDVPSGAPVGVGMPGSVTAAGLVKNSNTQCLNGRDFRRDLRNRISAPVAFANDANCFALAEAQYGAGQKYELVFGVIMGTGVGGGIVWNGEVREGPHSIAGEWGHTALWPDFGETCYCGKSGCVEQFISGPAVESMYRKTVGLNASMHHICQLAQRGDSQASACIDSLVDNFARALSNVMNTLDPDAVVLGGGLSHVEALYTRGVERLKKYVFSDEMTTPILQNALGDSAGVIGAAMLPVYGKQ